jgi:hypothetical protein
MKNNTLNSFRKVLPLATSLCLLLLTSGCFDTKEDYTINPDGSGKVVHECSFQSLDLSGQNPEADEALRNAVREVLDKSEGVEAWRDVRFKTLDDGRLFFRGTAYFKDLSKLVIQNQQMLKFGWKRTADGGGNLDLRTNDSEPVASHNLPEGGTVSITSPAKQSRTSTNALSPEELAKKIKQDRVQFQQAKPMLAGFLGTMKQTAVFHLPGKVASSSNFAKDASGALTLTFDGAKFLEVMEKLVNDDEWCRKHAGTGFEDAQSAPSMDDEMCQMIFGEKAPVRAVVAAGQTPLFDYAAEAAAARKDYAKVQKELKIGGNASGLAGAAASPSQGGALKTVRVAGVRLITESDMKSNLRPFNYDTGYTLAVRVEFSGSVLSVGDGTAVETALADDGSSLLPDKEFDRQISFPQLSTDKTAAMLEVKLKTPGSGVKGLKELSGRVGYNVITGEAKEVDLGFDELKAGAVGTELSAKIMSIQDGWKKDGSKMINVQFNASPDAIKSLSLLVDGAKEPLQKSMTSFGGKSCTLGYQYKQAFPPKARLVAEVYDKLQTFEAPFKLENLTLLGASVNGQK